LSCCGKLTAEFFNAGRVLVVVLRWSFVDSVVVISKSMLCCHVIRLLPVAVQKFNSCSNLSSRHRSGKGWLISNLFSAFQSPVLSQNGVYISASILIMFILCSQ